MSNLGPARQRGYVPCEHAHVFHLEVSIVVIRRVLDEICACSGACLRENLGFSSEVPAECDILQQTLKVSHTRQKSIQP